MIPAPLSMIGAGGIDADGDIRVVRSVLAYDDDAVWLLCLPVADLREAIYRQYSGAGHRNH
jgi:hypothetical protein